MKLKNNFWWKMYKRYYKGHNLELPENICQYSRRCLGGLIQYLWFDFTLLIMLPALCLISFLFFIPAIANFRTGAGLGFFLVGFLLACTSFLMLVVRITKALEKKGLDAPFVTFLIFSFAVGMFSIIFVPKESSWQPIHLWYSFLSVSAFILFILLIGLICFLFSKESPFHNRLKGFKEKICPLVTPPDDPEIKNDISQ